MSLGGGYIIFLADKELQSSPVTWSSTKIKRVVRSSLAAEALIAVDCADSMTYVNGLLEEITNKKEIRQTIVTDSNNLIQSLMLPHPVKEKRLRIELALLQEDVNKGRIAVKHCPGAKQIANILTKRRANPKLI